MKSFSYDGQRVLLGRLERGDEILAKLTAFCRDRGIKVGILQAIGAVERGGVGYYDQEAGEYREVRFERGMEIASLHGNISTKASDVFLHCHVVFADEQGRCIGGHLLDGCVAFACEFAVTNLVGETPVRVQDDATGLMLW